MQLPKCNKSVDPSFVALAGAHSLHLPPPMHRRGSRQPSQEAACNEDAGASGSEEGAGSENPDDIPVAPDDSTVGVQESCTQGEMVRTQDNDNYLYARGRTLQTAGRGDEDSARPDQKGGRASCFSLTEVHGDAGGQCDGQRHHRDGSLTDCCFYDWGARTIQEFPWEDAGEDSRAASPDSVHWRQGHRRELDWRRSSRYDRGHVFAWERAARCRRSPYHVCCVNPRGPVVGTNWEEHSFSFLATTQEVATILQKLVSFEKKKHLSISLFWSRCSIHQVCTCAQSKWSSKQIERVNGRLCQPQLRTWAVLSLPCLPTAQGACVAARGAISPWRSHCHSGQKAQGYSLAMSLGVCCTRWANAAWEVNICAGFGRLEQRRDCAAARNRTKQTLLLHAWLKWLLCTPCERIDLMSKRMSRMTSKCGQRDWPKRRKRLVTQGPSTQTLMTGVVCWSLIPAIPQNGGWSIGSSNLAEDRSSGIHVCSAAKSTFITGSTETCSRWSSAKFSTTFCPKPKIINFPPSCACKLSAIRSRALTVLTQTSVRCNPKLELCLFRSFRSMKRSEDSPSKKTCSTWARHTHKPRWRRACLWTRDVRTKFVKWSELCGAIKPTAPSQTQHTNNRKEQYVKITLQPK